MAASSEGIAFDGTNWHVGEAFGDQFGNYDESFAFLGTTTVNGVQRMGGLAFADNTGTLFVIDLASRIVRETQLEGTVLQQFTARTPGSPLEDIAYDSNTDTLWLAYFGTGLVENRSRDGSLLSSFTTPFRWTGVAFDPVSDTLLLLDTGDSLLEFTKTGNQVQELLDDQIAGNGLGLDYEPSTGTLHASVQGGFGAFGEVAIFQDPGRVIGRSPFALTVTNTNVSGLGSLREAIAASNRNLSSSRKSARPSKR